MYMLANIITAVGALIGFAFGSFRFFRPRTAIYGQIITLSVGCMAFGRIYQVIRMLTIGDIREEFHLGVLGVIGSLIFLLSANYGVMDGLADDRTEKFRKYRQIPAVASAITTAAWLGFFLFADQPVLVKVVSGIISALIMCASYYNLKHLIFPDVDYGVISCLKTYNLLALIYEVLCFVEMFGMSRDIPVLVLVVGILMGGILPSMVFAVARGMKKWLT